MKKKITSQNTSLWLALMIIIALSTKSCRKDFSNEFNIPAPQQLQWAKNYYETKLKSNQKQLLIQSKMMSSNKNGNNNRKNSINILWDAGYSAKTPLYDFVEVPMNMDGKIMPTFLVTKDPNAKPILDLQVINASLNRLVIYKDENGKTSQRVITYVPERDYLDKHNGNISHNKINKLDKDFFGYLQYKDWEGNVLFILRIENGRSVRKIDMSRAMTQEEASKMAQTETTNAIGNTKVMKYQIYTCGEWTLKYNWEQWCYYGGNSQTPSYCDPPEVYNVQVTPNCPGGGPPASVDCNDPSNFDNAACTGNVEIITDALTAKFPCATKKVIDSLKKMALYRDIIEPFKTPGMNPTLKWDATATVWGTDNTYMAGYTESDPSAGGIGSSSIIYLSSNMLTNSSRLFIAATAIHETYHAYIGAVFAYKDRDQYYVRAAPSFAAAMYQWSLYKNYGISDYTSHLDMMTTQFDKMTDILYDYGNGSYTVEECRMALLFGLNNPGVTASPTQQQYVADAYQALLDKYYLTPSEINTFNINNLNAPSNKKLPTTGC